MAQWSTILPRVLTSPPPGHGRIEIEMSSISTPPAGSRTNPVLANEGHVGGAYVLVWQFSSGGVGAGAPWRAGIFAPRCVTYQFIAQFGCSCYMGAGLKRSVVPAWAFSTIAPSRPRR